MKLKYFKWEARTKECKSNLDSRCFLKVITSEMSRKEGGSFEAGEAVPILFVEYKYVKVITFTKRDHIDIRSNQIRMQMLLKHIHTTPAEH